MYVYVNYKSNWITIIGLEKNYCPHGLHRRTPSSQLPPHPYPNEAKVIRMASYLIQMKQFSTLPPLFYAHNTTNLSRTAAENLQTCESLVAPKHHGNFNFGKIFLSLDIFKSPGTLLVLFYPVFLIINSFCSTFFETFTFLIRKHVAKSANISKTARRVRR